MTTTVKGLGPRGLSPRIVERNEHYARGRITSSIMRGLVTISINGSVEQPPEDPRVSLLDYLREQLGLHGTKKGCAQGACGACTVLGDVNGSCRAWPWRCSTTDVRSPRSRGS